MEKKYKSLTISKTRLIKRAGLQTWVKAELLTEFESDPTMEDVLDVISDIDTILIEEEKTENVRWNEIENKQRK